MKNSIIANEELVRGVNVGEVLSLTSKSSKISNKISIVSFSDSILGKTPESFVEGIQCNLYQEIHADLEAKMEDEMLTNPTKEKERNYGYLKKVIMNY